jgi:hypothetical protein
LFHGAPQRPFEATEQPATAIRDAVRPCQHTEYQTRRAVRRPPSPTASSAYVEAAVAASVIIHADNAR